MRKTQQLTINDVYGLTKPIWMRLIKEFTFLNITNETYSMMFQKAALNTLENYQAGNNIDIKTFFTKKMYYYIRSYVLKEIANKNLTEIAFLEQFIENNLKSAKTMPSAERNLDYLDKIVKFFLGELTLENALKLVENSEILGSLLKKMNQSNQDGGFENCNKTMFVFQEAYLLLHDEIVLDALEVDEDSLEISMANLEYATEQYFKEIPKSLLSAQEEQELIKRMPTDASAAAKLIEYNLRLVIKVAKKYVGQGLSFLDLIQEGNIGLMKAVSTYDSSKGFQLSTYAVTCIAKNIKRAIENLGRSIRVPSYMIEKMNRVEMAKRNLENYGLVSEQAISAATGLSVQEIQKTQNVIKDSISIYSTTESGEEINYLDSWQCEELSIEDGYENIALNEGLQEALAVLNERELNIIVHRFGLNGQEEQSLSQLGSQYGLTCERIRQIEKRALEKLQIEMHKQKFKYFEYGYKR